MSHPHIVVQIVFCFLRVQNIAGVAHGDFADLAGFQDFLDGNLHTLHPVKGVKNTKNVNPALGGFFNKLTQYIIRIVFIPNRVGPAQQHLEQDVRNTLAQLIQSSPRRFFQEIIGDVKGRAAPHFQRKNILSEVGGFLGDLDHIAAADPGCKQRLVRVAQGSIAQKQLILTLNPFNQAVRALFIQNLLGTAKLDASRNFRNFWFVKIRFAAKGFVDGHFAKVTDHVVGLALFRLNIEQFRMIVNEFGITVAALKHIVFQHVDQKILVCLNTLNLHFLEGTQRLAAGILKGSGIRGGFH